MNGSDMLDARGEDRVMGLRSCANQHFSLANHPSVKIVESATR